LPTNTDHLFEVENPDRAKRRLVGNLRVIALPNADLKHHM